MKKILSIGLILILTLLTACANGETSPSEDKEQEQTQAENQNEEKQETVPDAAVTNIDAIVQEQGKYTAEEAESGGSKEQELLDLLEQFPDGMTGKEAYNRIIPLVAADIKQEAEDFEAVDPVIRIDASTPESEIEIPETEQVNVVILLDASGSMAAEVSGGQKMELAKQAIKQYAAGMPKDANVMLRVYGQEGTGSDADKQMSCESSEVVYPLNAYNEAAFDEALNKFEPAGWTPLAGVMTATGEDLADDKENTRNVIYVVSDGIETCDGDPVAAAKALKDDGIATELNIIGFDVDNEGQKQLNEVAEAADGLYKSIYSESDLNDYLEQEQSRLYWEWLEWSNDRSFDVLAQSNDIHFDMLGLKNDIVFKSLAHKNLMYALHYDLDDMGKFKNDEEKQIYIDLINQRDEAVNEYFNNEMERKDEIRLELKEKYDQYIDEQREQHS